eukprot:359853-Chlamydomonas_euryale.AAC.17
MHYIEGRANASWESLVARACNMGRSGDLQWKIRTVSRPLRLVAAEGGSQPQFRWRLELPQASHRRGRLALFIVNSCAAMICRRSTRRSCIAAAPVESARVCE